MNKSDFLTFYMFIFIFSVYILLMYIVVAFVLTFVCAHFLHELTGTWYCASFMEDKLVKLQKRAAISIL